MVPFTQWNPRRAFLWKGRDDADSGDEKQRVLYLFEERCEQKGVSIPQESAYSSPLQDSMQKAADFLRAITEVAPRDQRKELVAGWKANVLRSPAQFDMK